MKSETLTISLEKSTQDSIPFYSPSQPFGFVDEAAHNAQPSLNIFELNSGFNVPYWYASEPITQNKQNNPTTTKKHYKNQTNPNKNKYTTKTATP